MVLEKTLESPLNCKEIQPVHPKENKSWIFIGRTDAEDETPIFWPLDVKNWLIGKDPDAGEYWRQEEKGMIEDEMVGWHHQLTDMSLSKLGDSEGQGSLACCGQWCCKDSDTTDRLTWTEFHLTLPEIYHFPQVWNKVKFKVTQSCLTLCDPMECSSPGLPVHHQLTEFTQTHVHWARDVIQPSHPLLSPSPPAFNLSQHQGLFKWALSSYQVAKILEFQLPHQSFQSIFRTDFLSDRLVGSPCSSRDSQESSPTPKFKSINYLWHSAFFIVQLSHPYMTIGKTKALTRSTSVSK